MVEEPKVTDSAVIFMPRKDKKLADEHCNGPEREIDLGGTIFWTRTTYSMVTSTDMTNMMYVSPAWDSPFMEWRKQQPVGSDDSALWDKYKEYIKERK